MRLYLLTAKYPYDGRESFLETEILYLSKKFDEVIIVPFSGRSDKRIRKVPNNCIVTETIIGTGWSKYFHIFNYRSFAILIKEFFSRHVYLNYKRFKGWISTYMIINNYLSSNVIKNIQKDISTSDIIYSYWGRIGAFVLPFFYNKAKCVCRFHGDWDLWEESSGNYMPLRQKVLDSLSLAISISDKGKEYLLNHYKCSVIVSKLGTINIGKISSKSSDGVVRILSCSSVYYVKRVPLIYESLQLIDNLEVEWTHIGDGPDFIKLKEIVQNTKPNIHINLIGRLTNDEVHNYYQTHSVDLFVNMSIVEGIPVAIMEAISYNVPVIGTNVGSTSEIVTSESGLLISADPTCAEVKDAILHVLKMNLNPQKFWYENYNADVNYIKFASLLVNLK